MLVDLVEIMYLMLMCFRNRKSFDGVDMYSSFPSQDDLTPNFNFTSGMLVQVKGKEPPTIGNIWDSCDCVMFLVY